MMLNPASRIGISGLGLLLLSACSMSTITDMFPDKRKQYQYTTEVPDLEFPPDLSTSTIDGVNQRAQPEQAEGYPMPGSRPQLAENSIPPSELTGNTAGDLTKGKNHPPPILAESSDNVPLIEVRADFSIVWAEVSKALGRMQLEITQLNRTDGTFHIQYTGEKPKEDSGVFGDMADLFGFTESEHDKANQLTEFKIKVEQHGVACSIYVTDVNGKPQREGRGLELLKWLFKTLHSSHLSG